MKIKIRPILFCLFIVSLVFQVTSFADEKKYTLNIQFENDSFGGGTDRNFSHGTRIELLTAPLPWVTKLADKLPWFDSGIENMSEDGLEGRGSISIGQNIYTPANTYTSSLVHGERPYAGWLYIGIGLMATQGNEKYDRYDKLRLEIGVVGPLSYAQEIQTFWHSIFGVHVPEGWDHQLKNEPGLALYYEQAYRIFPKKKLFGFEYDGVPHIGGCIGNVFTYLSAGYIVRIGRELKMDFGPPLVRPSLPGDGYFTSEGFYWNLFIGLDGQIVLRNIFLDGNTFRDSHSVDKNTAVGDIQAGFTIRWHNLGLSYTQIFRTKQYRGQNGDDILGSLGISYYF